MKKPNLKKVKEYFKNAKTVIATNSSTEFEVNPDLFEINENSFYGMYFVNEVKDGTFLKTERTYHCVFDGKNYAIIKTLKQL